jgi:hypothetical protein
MKIIATAVILMGMAGLCRADDYGRAYQEGYREGARQAQGAYSIAPIAPIAPIPDVYRNTARDGYNKGVIEGTESVEQGTQDNSGW